MAQQLRTHAAWAELRQQRQPRGTASGQAPAATPHVASPPLPPFADADRPAQARQQMPLQMPQQTPQQALPAMIAHAAQGPAARPERSTPGIAGGPPRSDLVTAHQTVAAPAPATLHIGRIDITVQAPAPAPATAARAAASAAPSADSAYLSRHYLRRL